MSVALGYVSVFAAHSGSNPLLRLYASALMVLPLSVMVTAVTLSFAPRSKVAATPGAALGVKVSRPTGNITVDVPVREDHIPPVHRHQRTGAETVGPVADSPQRLFVKAGMLMSAYRSHRPEEALVAERSGD